MKRFRVWSKEMPWPGHPRYWQIKDSEPQLGTHYIEGRVFGSLAHAMFAVDIIASAGSRPLTVQELIDIGFLVSQVLDDPDLTALWERAAETDWRKRSRRKHRTRKIA